MKEQAKESRLVQKAREKLEKNLEIEHQAFTPETLDIMADKIRKSIVRHHPEPSFLKKRKFTLFTGGANPAATKSKQVLKLQKMLGQETRP
jgi:hypothetical protein